jgi:hypothetical protein
MNGFALEDLAYMDGDSLHVGIFKKDKWYDFHAKYYKLQRQKTHSYVFDC